MRSRRQGFTLVEMLVSILILAIGLVGGAMCLSLALTSNLRANHIALATELTQSEIERQRSEGDLAIGTFTVTNLNDPDLLEDDNLKYYYTSQLPQGRLDRVITNDDTQLNTRRVTVEVSWTGKHQQRESVQMVTIAYKREKHQATGAQ